MNKLTIIISLLFFIELNASGFQINEHGTKAMSLGGAFAGLAEMTVRLSIHRFAGLADDPSAIYFNPAGITQLNGINLIGGSTLIIPGSTFRGPSPSVSEYEIKSQIFTPVHIYATYQFEDKLFFGFGIGNNFGLGTEWDSDWAGKYLAVETSLRTFFFNFVTSYQIIPQISIGFGYSLVYGDVLMGRKLNLSPFNSDAYLELEGNGIGSGFTAGLLFHATNSISLGFSYRSKVSIQLFNKKNW